MKTLGGINRFRYVDAQKDELFITNGSKDVICIRCTDSLSNETAAVVINGQALKELKEFLLGC